MLTNIGQKPRGEGLEGALADCHERIRRMSALACRVAEHPEAAPDDVREAAARVRHYFAESLPLHVRDEEDSLRPRLMGRDGDVDRALAEMASEHAEHAAPLARLVAVMSDLVEAPARLPTLAAELLPLARGLERDLARHLEREERVVFPAISRLLDSETQQAIIAEQRARRDEEP